MTKDMTSGNPTKLILGFAVPLLLGNIFQQLYNMVDSIIVGRGIGVDALAAVGATGSINFLVLGFVIGLTTGFSILISQYYGAGDMDEMKRSVTMSVYLSIGATILITAVSVLGARPLLEIMNTPADILEDALAYIIIIFWGIGSTITFNLFSAMLRALGDSRTPLYAMIVSSLVNIGLDIYFVMNLQMGVAGAAYATVIAQILSCLFCFFRILGIKDLHLKKQHWTFHPELLYRLFKLGVPVAFMNSVTAIGVMVLQFVVNGYGSIYVAAYSSANKIMNLVEQPGVTFGLAMATFAGQNLGAKQYERIKLGLNKTIRISTTVNIVLAVIMLVFGKQILALMVSGNEVEVIDIAYQYIVICVLALWVLGLLFIYRSSLQGMGDTVIPMISGAVEFITRIIIAVTLPGIIAFHSIGTAEISAWITATLLLMATFYKRINYYLKHPQ